MKHAFIVLLAGFALFFSSSCSLDSIGMLPPATPTLSATPSPDVSIPTSNITIPTATTGGIFPDVSSGLYAVIQVAPGDTVKVYARPGTSNVVIGTLDPNDAYLTRTGPSFTDGMSQWVEIKAPVGATNPYSITGWVDATFLTEQVGQDVFCADSRVKTLITNFGNTIRASDGGALSPLISPVHGMTIRLGYKGNAVVFDRAQSKGIFTSTDAFDWGMALGNGLDTTKSFQSAVLPKWLDILNANHILTCDRVDTGGASYDPAWPPIYTHINFYSIYKPGPSGNGNSWRSLLIGVEYFQNQPYIFSVIQLE